MQYKLQLKMVHQMIYVACICLARTSVLASIYKIRSVDLSRVSWLLVGHLSPAHIQLLLSTVAGEPNDPEMPPFSNEQGLPGVLWGRKNTHSASLSLTKTNFIYLLQPQHKETSQRPLCSPFSSCECGICFCLQNYATSFSPTTPTVAKC